MKIRTSFISNSSTTSFLVITTIQGHKTALEKLGKIKAEALMSFKGFKKEKILGQAAIVLNYVTGDDYYIKDGFHPELLEQAFLSDVCQEDGLSCFAGNLLQEYMSEVRKQQDTYYQVKHY